MQRLLFLTPFLLTPFLLTPLLLLGCTCLTAPPDGQLDAPASAPALRATSQPVVAPERERVARAVTGRAGTPTPAPAAGPADGAQAAGVHAAHILIAYKGALRAQAATVRSKDEAQALAAKLRTQALDANTFAKLAQEHSDDHGSRPKGGDLGTFQRASMVKPFAEAAFALAPGQVSAVTETQFGFHVIRRIE